MHILRLHKYASRNSSFVPRDPSSTRRLDLPSVLTRFDIAPYSLPSPLPLLLASSSSASRSPSSSPTTAAAAAATADNILSVFQGVTIATRASRPRRAVSQKLGPALLFLPHSTHIPSPTSFGHYAAICPYRRRARRRNWRKAPRAGVFSKNGGADLERNHRLSRSVLSSRAL